MKKKILVISIVILLILILGLGLFLWFNKESDAEKFALEYNTVSRDNVFAYRSINQIINILEHGTGIVYLGFPECPWCLEYVKHLNEVAKQNKNISNIYYYNILNDRKENTDEYKKIVSILSEYLPFDQEGNKRVYVPAVIAVNNGRVVGFDDETAWNTKGYDTPQEYWENEDLEGLKQKLNVMMNSTATNYCTSGCNK